MSRLVVTHGGSPMLEFTTRAGRRINRRLRQETIIWLTTVDSHNTPQPRPVWFHWDGHTVLIFSERNKAKLRHVAQNSRVRSEEHTSELQSLAYLVCRLLLEKKNK